MNFSLFKNSKLKLSIVIVIIFMLSTLGTPLLNRINAQEVINKPSISSPCKRVFTMAMGTRESFTFEGIDHLKSQGWQNFTFIDPSTPQNDIISALPDDLGKGDILVIHLPHPLFPSNYQKLQAALNRGLTLSLELEFEDFGKVPTTNEFFQKLGSSIYQNRSSNWVNFTQENRLETYPEIPYYGYIKSADGIYTHGVSISTGNLYGNNLKPIWVTRDDQQIIMGEENYGLGVIRAYADSSALRDYVWNSFAPQYKADNLKKLEDFYSCNGFNIKDYLCKNISNQSLNPFTLPEFPRFNNENCVLISDYEGVLANRNNRYLNTYTFELEEEYTLTLKGYAIEGHPEEDCINNPRKPRCNQRQSKEEFKIFINDKEIYSHIDQGRDVNAWLYMNNTNTITLPKGVYTIKFVHNREGRSINSVGYKTSLFKYK